MCIENKLELRRRKKTTPIEIINLEVKSAGLKDHNYTVYVRKTSGETYQDDILKNDSP